MSIWIVLAILAVMDAKGHLKPFFKHPQVMKEAGEEQKK